MRDHDSNQKHLSRSFADYPKPRIRSQDQRYLASLAAGVGWDTIVTVLMYTSEPVLTGAGVCRLLAEDLVGQRLPALRVEVRCRGITGRELQGEAAGLLGHGRLLFRIEPGRIDQLAFARSGVAVFIEPLMEAVCFDREGILATTEKRAMLLFGWDFFANDLRPAE